MSEMPNTKPKPRVVKTSFYAPVEVHRQAKIRAAQEGRPLTELLLGLLVDYLKRAAR